MDSVLDLPALPESTRAFVLHSGAFRTGRWTRVVELARRTGYSKSGVKYHLGILRQCGLLEQRPKRVGGIYHQYRLNSEQIRHFMDMDHAIL